MNQWRIYVMTFVYFHLISDTDLNDFDRIHSINHYLDTTLRKYFTRNGEQICILAFRILSRT